jgi:hypothetical protein
MLHVFNITHGLLCGWIVWNDLRNGKWSRDLELKFWESVRYIKKDSVSVLTGFSCIGMGIASKLFCIQ